MMPKCNASGEYHTSTSVRSLARWLSTGRYSENPDRRVAFAQTGSSRRPSIVTGSSSRGIENAGAPTPSTTAWDGAAGAASDAACAKANKNRAVDVITSQTAYRAALRLARYASAPDTAQS